MDKNETIMQMNFQKLYQTSTNFYDKVRCLASCKKDGFKDIKNRT